MPLRCLQNPQSALASGKRQSDEMSTTTSFDLPHAAVERLEAALDERQPSDVARAVARLLLDDPGVRPGVEDHLRERLRSHQRGDRVSAAAAFQAVPLATRVRAAGNGNHEREAAAAESVEALIAALVVETQLNVRFELLSALAAQDYEADSLRHLAGVVGRLVQRVIEAGPDLDEVTDADLRRAHDRLRAAELVDPGSVLPRRRARRIVGYAATGIPFVLQDQANPEVVLVYNASLDAWLPPGGHFNPGMDQLPSETLVHKIKAEAGADSIVHWAPGLAFRSQSDSVELRPSPSFVLLEDLTKHPRRNPAEVHTHHYDLNYICQINERDVAKIGRGDYPAIRVPLGGLEAEVEDLREEVTRRIRARATADSPEHAQAAIFPDVVERIVLSLSVLAGQWGDKINSFELNGSANGDSAPHIDQVPFLVSSFSRGDPNGH